MDSDALISARHQALEGILDERQRRLHAAVEAKVLDEAATRRKSDAPSHDVMRMVMSSILSA